MTKVLFITPDFYPNSTDFANASINLIEAIKNMVMNNMIFMFLLQSL